MKKNRPPVRGARHRADRGTARRPGLLRAGRRAPASKKDAESRRDAIQKPTQSGVPGKTGGAPGKGP